MKPHRTTLVPALLLVAVLARPGAAQGSRVSLEARGGGAFPTGDFRGQASPGWTLGATLHYPVHPDLDVYGGVQHENYPTRLLVIDGPPVVEAEGYRTLDNAVRGGLRASPRIPLAGVRPWAEAGLTYGRVTFTAPDSPDTQSNWRAGYELGAGLGVGVGPRVTLTPGVRYRHHGTSFTSEGDEVKLDPTTRILAEAGVQIRL
ncbi:MAG TPA: outer membrane beta-barrel protein [Longimicrobium sp.]|nr:outer membrane beta-barrel protein [Longimicrobium sp.]